MMDETDFKIAKILCKNSRTPFKTIGEQIGVSTQTVMRKYKKLKKTLFSFSSITVNLEKLGFQATMGLHIKVSSFETEATSKVYNQIIKLPNIIVASKTLGPTSIILLVPIKTIEDVFIMLEKISNIHGVAEIDLTLFKPHHAWPRQIYANLLEDHHNKSNNYK
ncbi:MAG: hypothetical protein CW691_05385 [Candidatus Bathyarchaeum sp.]|nr:MAG: hypothetical protein CW691_05385 [Candidatus Bathyarchaeum sp.]